MNQPKLPYFEQKTVTLVSFGEEITKRYIEKYVDIYFDKRLPWETCILIKRKKLQLKFQQTY